MPEVIDARGLCCPHPKILAFEPMYRGVLEILVLIDDPGARDGLIRLAGSLGYKAVWMSKESYDEVRLARGRRGGTAVRAPVRQAMGTVMESFEPGLFAGGAALDSLQDNLALERFFRLPKAHGS